MLGITKQSLMNQKPLTSHRVSMPADALVSLVMNGSDVYPISIASRIVVLSSRCEREVQEF